MAERLLQNNPPIFTQVCLSTFEDVTAYPLGAIWTCPRDYREAIKGTCFDTEKIRINAPGYRRQTEREIHVERAIKKFALLVPE